MPGTETRRSGWNLAGISGTGRNENRDENDVVSSWFSHQHGTFWSEQHGIDIYDLEYKPTKKSFIEENT
jgi:hypothetical protein